MLFLKSPLQVSSIYSKFVKSIIAMVFTIATTLLISSWGNSHELVGGGAAHQLAITYHKLNLKGNALTYKATTGYLPVNNENDQLSANIFYTAYTAGIVADANRPITFVFNGGPGSAAIWLHLGSVAPVRAVFKNDKGDAPNGLYKYTPNQQTWLRFTDLVFIDPVSTGYSRADSEVNARKFYNYKADVASIGEFIRRYLQQQRREGSPKFLIGESYGAVRAIGLTEYLQEKYQMNINGLTLISPALNYELLSFRKDNQKAYPNYLPAYAATAHYHQRLAPELQQLSPKEVYARANTFAKGAYTRFLNGESSPNIIDSIAYYTGLSEKYVRTINGRISDKRFANELLKTDSLTLGNYDSRFTAPANTIADPSETNIRDLFTKVFDGYVNKSLRYKNTLSYNATIGIAGWHYDDIRVNGYINASAGLKKIMDRNPALKINIVGGYYDLATPIATTEQVLADLDLPATQRANISQNYYDSGHMVYISKAANARFQRDGERFYASF